MVILSARATVVLGLLIGDGCSDNEAAPPDAPRGPCWPSDTATTGGAIALGTGMPFVELPDSVPLMYYLRGDLYYVPLNARVTSIQPGNSEDTSDPANPRTRFRGYYADTGAMMTALPISCPIRIGYRPSTDPGTFELNGRTGVEFPSGMPVAELFGRQIRVEVEVIDSDGQYARDEKIITCLPPTEEPTLVGIEH